MLKAAVLGDYDSIYGFGTIGLDTYPVTDPEEAEKTLHHLAGSDYAVVYITEALAKDISPAIAKYEDQMLPAIIRIPGIFGNTGDGVRGVKQFVETAVGSDILFSQQN